MRAITTIGLDFARSVFQVHGVDVEGKVVFRHTPSLRCPFEVTTGKGSDRADAFWFASKADICALIVRALARYCSGASILLSRTTWPQRAISLCSSVRAAAVDR